MNPPTDRPDGLCVDLSEMTAYRDGVRLDLEPKAFDVLRLLVERRDQLITKDELIDTVWADTFVTPNVLTRAVAQIRRELRDDPQDARFIETVMKRGYRFIGPVTVVSSASRASLDVGQAPAVARVEAAVAARSEAPASDASPMTIIEATTQAPPPRAAEAWSMAAAPAPGPPRGAQQSRATPLWVAGALGAAFTIAMVWAARSGGLASSPNLPTPEPRPTKVTLSVGANTRPTLSPDGSALAYSSDRSGSLEIYVVGLTRGSRDIALTSDGHQNVDPAWAPDGKWIAYHARAKGGLWVIPATGGSPVQVAESGSQPAWSPDAQSIVFSTTEGSMAGQSVLRVVRRDGSGERDLTRVGHPLGGHLRPTWSRNGRFIAFSVSDGRSRSSAWVVSSEGGEPQRLPIEGGFSGMAFGPDDRYLYFRGGDPTRGVIYRLPIDPADATALGAPAELLSTVSLVTAEGLSISNNGTIAYDESAAEGHLWSVDVDASGERHEPQPFIRSSVRTTAPAYSRTGRFAFQQGGSGAEVSVWMSTEDGSGAEPAFGDGTWTAPSMSDDGHVLALKNTVPPTLWLLDPATRRTTAVGQAATGRLNVPRISPDGNEIAYWLLEPNGAMNTWTVPVSGGSPRRITSDAEAANYPAWSPDGQWLAIEVKRGEETQIGVVSRHGGAIEQLTNERGQNWPHSWSPDGESIAFAGQRRGVWNIYSVSRRTHVVTQHTHFTSASGYVRYPAWAPDGRRIVFERRVAEGNIWTFQEP